MNRIARIAAIIAQGNDVYQTYAEQIKNLFGVNLIDHLPLDESSGTVARDQSGNGRDGVYSGVALNNKLSPTGHNIPLFGAGSVDIGSASFNAAFDGNELGIVVVAGLAGSAEWNEPATRMIVSITGANAPWPQVCIRKVQNSIQGAYVDKSLQKYTINPAMRWFQVVLTCSVSNDRMRLYVNGKQEDATLSLLTAWGGGHVPERSIIGADTTAPASPFVGYGGDASFVNREITPAEVAALWSYLQGTQTFTVLGDSISAGIGNWPDYVITGYNGGLTTLKNHAVAGDNIDTHMATRVAAAASDNANRIIIMLGTNDGTAVGVQDKYTAGLNSLKASNPRATIFCLGILAATAGAAFTNGATAAINTAISNAATATGCAYVNTSAWIVPAVDTNDGWHPNAGGVQKIVTQILALP